MKNPASIQYKKNSAKRPEQLAQKTHIVTKQKSEFKEIIKVDLM